MKQIFTKEECNQIIGMTSNLEKKRKLFKEMNERNVGFNFYFIYPNEETMFIFDRINKFFEEDTGFIVNKNLDNIMLNEYLVGDSFQKHQDFYIKQQLFTLIVNLNDDYEGGDFLLFEPDEILPKQAGMACAFRNTKWHEVKPVTNNIRYSLVGFYKHEHLKKTIM